MNAWWLIRIGITVAVLVIFIVFFWRWIERKKEIKLHRWAPKEERKNWFRKHIKLIFDIVLGIIAISTWIFPRPVKLDEETRRSLRKEISEDAKQIERETKHSIYLDGLPFATPKVFDPFAKGVKLMRKCRIYFFNIFNNLTFFSYMVFLLFFRNVF